MQSKPLVEESRKISTSTAAAASSSSSSSSLSSLRRKTTRDSSSLQTSKQQRKTFGFYLTLIHKVVIVFFFLLTSTLDQASSSSSSSTATTRREQSVQVVESNSISRSNSKRSRIVVQGDSSSAVTMDAFSKDDSIGKDDNEVMLVFSDVDGTLLHYPKHDSNTKDDDDDNDSNKDNALVRLPPSATGLVGIISSKTLQQCQDIRRSSIQQGSRKGGCKLILISGMRTSTLLQRLPYLPKADAYCSEAGGRIFYPTSTTTTTTTTTTASLFTPKAYSGATPSDLQPFGLVEDMEWRRRMTRLEAAGPDGYDNDTALPVEQRQGALWDFARQLQQRGLVLDTRGYATCFRVNRKHNKSNDDDSSGGTTTTNNNNVFDDVLMMAADNNKIDIPKELATSTNLGCVDFYPAESGKLNCCKYLALKFLSSMTGGGGDAAAAINNEEGGSNDDDASATASTSDGGGDDERKAALLLAQHAVCLCDDDNDLEMALACQHAFIPGISSESMAETIGKNPTQFTFATTATATDTSSVARPAVQEGTPSTTEAVLTLVLERIRSSRKE